jgi:hypothetical protein
MSVFSPQKAATFSPNSDSSSSSSSSSSILPISLSFTNIPFIPFDANIEDWNVLFYLLNYKNKRIINKVLKKLLIFFLIKFN